MIGLNPIVLTGIAALTLAGQGQKGAVGPQPRPLDQALLAAVGRRDLKEIKKLVAKGADPDAEFVDHADVMEEPISDAGMLLTPLISAARSGDTDVVRTLLALGAKPNHKGRSGETALLWAVADGHQDSVRVLLAWGAKPNDSAYKGKPVLIFAVRLADAQLVTLRLLVAKGADVNAKDSSGQTALMEAVDDIVPDNVNFLIRMHAALNTQDHRGRTALMVAASLGSKSTVAALIAAHADVNIHDNKGWTALSIAQYALAHNGPLEGRMIYDGSIEGRADFVSEMHRAAKLQYGGIVKLLLKHGAKSSPIPSRRIALKSAGSHVRLVIR